MKTELALMYVPAPEDKLPAKKWQEEEKQESTSGSQTVESVKINSSLKKNTETTSLPAGNPWPGVFNALAIAILGAAILYAIFWFYKKNKK